MKVWIIEDEPPALRRLIQLLKDARPDWNVAHTADSISSTVAALETRPHPDLIFSDIQLADGLAFSIWEKELYRGPIIFTTAYDQYGVRAFRVNSIDYLMKPVEADELQRALRKVTADQPPAPRQDWAAIAELIRERRPSYRQRFLAQQGSDWLPVRVDALRQIYSADGLSFGLTRSGQRILLNEPLDRIEEELDPTDWLRINRAQIVHVEAVERVEPYFNHRLALTLQPRGENDNIVSRARVKRFRRWLDT